ncbi:ankyrin repeat protein [Trichinella nativa]|uniref:Ankyrin repeat protein n=1 Tax=Trichinella nativa TaxID=6335 RepID=A0A1Y3EYH7_9BILA|nr:ankyrin repeat protein [Trichinella nativa]
MGNYMKRPKHSLSDELYDKISKGYRLSLELLERGLLNDVALTSDSLLSELLIACYENDVNRFKSVLENLNLNVNSISWRKMSLLHIAVLCEKFEIVKSLLEKEADVHQIDWASFTPLHLASYFGFTEIEKSTVFHYCAQFGHLEIMKLLLDDIQRYDIISACVHEGNLYGDTPLHNACTAGKSVDLIGYLLKQPGVNVNCQGRDGHTPLHSACYNGHLKVVKFLLDQGADMDISANSQILRKFKHANSGAFGDSDVDFENTAKGPISMASQTPIAWAYEQGFDNIVNLLKDVKRSEYSRSSASECSYNSLNDYASVTLPSPMGKLKSVTKEKAEVLQLRNLLGNQYHIQMSDIDLQESVGSGSFGKVYKCVLNNRTVAVKRYRSWSVGSKSDVKMFCREVSIMSRLNHPNILQFIGACLDDPSNLLRMDRYLTPYMKKNEFKFSICFDVASAMNYLHKRSYPIIHRDLNPHNILLKGNRALVADFGESRFVDSRDIDMTRQPGNLRWMAPEIFLQSGSYTTKADVFSYALCVWEIYTGDIPFVHLKPATAAAEMAYRNNRPLLSDAIPVKIQSLINKAWHSNVQYRPEFSVIMNELMGTKKQNKEDASSLPVGDDSNSNSQSEDSAVLLSISRFNDLLKLATWLIHHKVFLVTDLKISQRKPT